MRGVNFHSVSFPSAKSVALLDSLFVYKYIYGSLLTAFFFFFFFFLIKNERDELLLYLLAFCKSLLLC